MASNYRPVSITCIASKLMEHILVSSMMNQAHSQNISYHLQHGFHSWLSCETYVIKFIHDLVTYMQSGTQTDVIVMDSSKALYKASNNKLMLDPSLWVRQICGSDDFCQIEPRVVVEGETSSEVPVTSGIPQGSVISPCLFLFYINDILDNITSTIRLSTDDTSMYLAIKPNSNNAAVLQEDLDKLRKWCFILKNVM